MSPMKNFVPVLLEGAHHDDIPAPLQGVPSYSPVDESGYEALYRRLTGQPRVTKGDLGELRPLPSPRLKLEPSPQVDSPGRRPRSKSVLPVILIAVAAAVAGVWRLYDPTGNSSTSGTGPFAICR